MAILVVVSLAAILTGLRTYFITMPERNPPLFEDLVSWIAWRTKEPVTIVYVGSTDIRHRVQYQVDTRMVPHKYIGVTVEDFDWQKLPTNSIVFYEQQAQGIPTPPQSFNNVATYVNQDGVAIGYAWTATNVDLQPQPILAGLINVPIPAMLGVVILGLMVFLMRGKIRLEKNENGKGFRLTVEIWLRESNKKENPS